MPTIKKFNEGSIIYFDKDVGTDVFLLKSGKVIIKFISEDTGEEVSKVVRPGEIFGLKSALISAPRGETAISAEPSEVVSFDIKEFESFISSKPEILFKTLKALSNQLRNIGIKVNNLLSDNVVVKPDVGMFKIGEYFLMNKKYKQAIQVFERFLKSYPDSSLVDEAKKRIQIAKKAMETGILDRFKPIMEDQVLQNTQELGEIEVNSTLSSILGALSLAENNYSRGNIDETLKILDKVFSVRELPSLDLLERALSLKARALAKAKMYDESIKTYRELMEKFPNSKNMKTFMFNMAIVYLEKGDKSEALMLLRKVSAMSPYDDISQKAKEFIAKMSL